MDFKGMGWWCKDYKIRSGWIYSYRSTEQRFCIFIVKKRYQQCIYWLDEIWVKRWFAVNELEMPGVPWLHVLTKAFKGSGNLECQSRFTGFTLSHWGVGSEDMPFTHTLINRFVKGTTSLCCHSFLHARPCSESSSGCSIGKHKCKSSN